MPVSMAAATTILGMILLLQDAFFVSMAVTIMVGLGFAPIPPAPRGSRIS